MLRRLLVFVLAVIVFSADQWTKHWATYVLAGGRVIPIIPRYFEFALTTNTGAAFGMFQSATLLLGIIALCAVLAIVIYVFTRRDALPTYQSIALGLALGGACGNFLDRFRLHHVIDFIFVHLGTYPWPVFNVADSAICVGVVILAVRYATLLGKANGHPNKGNGSPLQGHAVVVEPSIGPGE